MNYQTSRFARVEEIEHPDSKRINNELIQLNKDFSFFWVRIISKETASCLVAEFN